MLMRSADGTRFICELFPDDPDLPRVEGAQRMHGNHQGDLLTLVENRCGDSGHGLFSATWVVVRKEADGGELDE